MDFQRKAGRHGDFPGTELFSGLGNLNLFFGGELPVPGNHTYIEYIAVPLILQASKPLDPFDFFGRKLLPVPGNFYFIEKCASFQNFGVRVS